jgi:hypothetical protein
MKYLDPKYFNPEKELKYGIYHCDIKSDIHSRFIYNPNNWYTHFDIQLAMKQGLPVKLIDSPNNLIYWKTTATVKPKPMPADCVRSDKVFGEYIWKLFKLKQQYRANKFLKSCLSGLWGRLCEQEKYYKIAPIKEGVITIEEDEVFDCIAHSDDTNSKYRVLNRENPYATNYARLKPFLFAKQRLMMYDMVFKQYKESHKFIRIRVDGFIVDKRIQEFDDNSKEMGKIVFDKEYHNIRTPNKNVIIHL